jgi:hypothetical protein
MLCLLVSGGKCARHWVLGRGRHTLGVEQGLQCTGGVLGWGRSVLGVGQGPQRAGCWAGAAACWVMGRGRSTLGILQRPPWVGCYIRGCNFDRWGLCIRA